MAWNEPGGGQKDPWSGGGGNQGPPELDEIVRKLQERLGGLFGGKRRTGGGGGGTPAGAGKFGFGLIAGIVLVVWMLSGIYIVEPAQRGVELRFGQFSTITDPGPHWHIPYPVEDVHKVNVDQITSVRHKAEMLTQDENIVDIELTVQYRVRDAADYLFQVRDPDVTLKDATETAVREVIGKNKLDFVLTEGRSAIADRTRQDIQGLLDQYKTGLMVTSVNMQPAKPPEEVKSAFDDAIKAREDKERLENEAQAYANEVVPKARGGAARMLEEAKAYRARMVAQADGEANRFLKVLTEYEKAPQVTRERLYLEAIETVLAGTGKVVVDVEGGNNLMYLPLDKLMQRSASGRAESGDSASVPVPSSQPLETESTRPMRGRRAR